MKAILIVLGLFLVLSLTNARSVSKRNPGILLTQGGEDPDPEVRQRRDFVKSMLQDAWEDYKRYAWGENELKPISQVGQDGGIYGDSKIGATIIDALDTLYIAGYDDEFQLGREWIAKNFDFNTVNTSVSLFETNIRIIGGFLTAYALTGDQLFADKAYEVGKAVLPAFDTPTGLPYDRINPATGATSGTTISLAGFGTLHLEFIYLSEITGDPIFAAIVLRIQDHMNKIAKINGLYPNTVSSQTGQFTDTFVSMGGGADSFYEYLLKSWVQTNDTTARKMYDEAIDAFDANGLFQLSSPSQLLIIAETRIAQLSSTIGSHLECFAGGMLALGSVTDPRNQTSGGKQQRDFDLGKNFTNTCHESYIRSPTHIGPETFRFTAFAEAVGTQDGDKYYILRPEVIESYFVLYRLTKDPKYRDWAWDAAQAIQRYCKAGPGRGYSGLRDVYNTNPQQDDVQQTFFLAETLKYLYLIFSSDDLISLDNWVFNTECHPLPIKGKNPMF